MPRSPKKKTEEDVKPDQKPYPKEPATTSPKKVIRGWTKEEKEIILLEVIASAKPDFEAIASRLEGRTASQVSELRPRINGEAH